ncbi:MAG: PAS domain S-box protein [Herpetosiphonaceae bacterium]|nr:PAS domain S-box protein [Herpetosiphonaceae bacterium]
MAETYDSSVRTVAPERAYEVAASRQLQAQIIAHVNDAVVVTGPDFHIQLWNTAAEQLYGWTATEVLGRTVNAVLPVRRYLSGADEATIRQQLIELGSWRGEVVQEHQAGHNVFVDSSVQVIRDDSGAVSSVVAINRDITERRQAEEALRRSEARFRAATEGSLDAFVILDSVRNEHGAIIDFTLGHLNTPAEELLSLSQGVALGHRVLELFPGAPGSGTFGKLVNVLESGVPLEEEVAIESPRLTATWLRWQIVPLADGLAITLRDISARKQMENSLHHERNLLHALMDSIPDTIYFKDAQGRFTRINRAQVHMLGVNHEDEALGKTDADFFDAQLASASSEDERQLIATGQPVIDQIQHFQGPDGVPIWVSATKVPIVDRSGQPVGLVGISRDITARMHVEDDLRRSEARLVEAQRVARLGSWARDLTTGRITWSDELYHVFGVTPQAFGATLEAFLAFVHPDDRPLLEAMLAGIVVDHQPFHIDYRIVRQDGEVRVMSERGELVLNDQGRAQYLVGTTQDITERAHAEEALRLRDQAIAATTNGIILTDATAPDNPIIIVNPAFLQITGYSERDILGRNCRFLQGPATDPATVALLRSAISQEQPVTVEILNYHKDGTTFWNALSIAPMHDVWGRLTNFVGIQQDITARKQATQLSQAKEVAEQANQAKSEFLSRLSHELRTPLNSILGFAQLLAGEQLRPEQSESVGYIVAGGRHLLKLIDDVLDIQGIEAGRMALVVEALLIDDIVQEALDLTLPLARQGQIRVHGPDPIAREQPVLADRRRLMQVLLNLLSNAIKYTPAGGMVTVRYQPAGERLRIEISDTGHGIPESKLPRLFMPFERLGAEATGIEGTGLGLALSKALVEEMGGSVGACSAVGQGSSFWFELPFAEPVQSSAIVEPAEEVASR